MPAAGDLLAAAAPLIGRSDARIVLAHLAGLTREQLIMHPEHEVDSPTAEAFLEAVEKVARGCPVAYITGRREFWGRSFAVTPDVLVPRPDTETLVEEALAVCRAGSVRRVLDLGTGSGIIAVTLALEGDETVTIPFAEVKKCTLKPVFDFKGRAKKEGKN